MEGQITDLSESIEGKELDDKSFSKILKQYEKQLIVPQIKPGRQFIILPVGLVGAGKSTVIKGLAKKLPVIIIRTDDVRRLLLQDGFNLLRTMELTRTSVERYLKQGYSLALDGDCAGPVAQLAIKELPTGIKRLWIHIVADEKNILDRLSGNKADRFYTGPKAVANYYARKRLHQHLLMPFVYTFDATKDNFQDQIDEAVIIIREEIAL